MSSARRSLTAASQLLRSLAKGAPLWAHETTLGSLTEPAFKLLLSAGEASFEKALSA
jgi:hypothetical protein